MVNQRLPLLSAAGDLDKPFTTCTAKIELAPGVRPHLDSDRHVHHSDNGSELINHDGAAWLQGRDIEQPRVEQRIAGTNPPDLTRQINQIRSTLTRIAKEKTETLATSKPLDLESLKASSNRLTGLRT